LNNPNQDDCDGRQQQDVKGVRRDQAQ